MPVFITDIGRFLPNAPVDNEHVEDILGVVGARPSRAKRVTLRNNGIVQRHYAIDPATGLSTHTNAQLTAEAVRDVLARSGRALADCDVLACGTSSPDQLKPAHANMVHGELQGARLEVATNAGVCSAGMAALKYAYLSVRAGDARRAISTGSELASSFMVARNFTAESSERVDAAERCPSVAFEKDFLRWMLSDGAGAALLEQQPNAARISLRIDWIDSISLAGEFPVCMYSGAIKLPDGRLRGWREAAGPLDMVREQYLTVKQDARLLDSAITSLVASGTLQSIVARRSLSAGQVDWFVPHVSSLYFTKTLTDTLEQENFAIPRERWFINLPQVGNVGSASVYLALEELLRSGRLERGQRILCFVPESARFSVFYMQLTVV